MASGGSRCLGLVFNGTHPCRQTSAPGRALTGAPVARAVCPPLASLTSPDPGCGPWHDSAPVGSGAVTDYVALDWRLTRTRSDHEPTPQAQHPIRHGSRTQPTYLLSLRGARPLPIGVRSKCNGTEKKPACRPIISIISLALYRPRCIGDCSGLQSQRMRSSTLSCEEHGRYQASTKSTPQKGAGRPSDIPPELHPRHRLS